MAEQDWNDEGRKARLMALNPIERSILAKADTVILRRIVRLEADSGGISLAAIRDEIDERDSNDVHRESVKAGRRTGEAS